MSEAKQKHYPKHTGDNGGAPAGTPAKQRPSSLAEGAWATTEHPTRTDQQISVRGE